MITRKQKHAAVAAIGNNLALSDPYRLLVLPAELVLELRDKIALAISDADLWASIRERRDVGAGTWEPEDVL